MVAHRQHGHARQAGQDGEDRIGARLVQARDNLVQQQERTIQ